MRMKPKTVRRLTLLAALGCVLIVCAFSLVFVRKWQSERLTERYRDRALQAYQLRDYTKTIENAGAYLKRGDQRDAEILLAYAEARLNLQEHDGRHLAEASHFYQRYIEVRPDDQETRFKLLDLLNRAGYFPEAADLARMLRPQNLAEAGSEHLAVLEQEALAQVGAKRFDSAEQVIQRIFELDPLNAHGALLRLDIVSLSDVQGRRIPDLQSWAEAFLAEHPEEAVPLVTAASAMVLSRNELDVPQIRARLAKASGIDPATGRRIAPGAFTSQVLAKRLVETLDLLRLHEWSLEVLRDLDDRAGDPELRVRLVRRLWQDSMFDEVVARTGGIDPTQYESEPVLLGFRALSLAALGQRDEAQAIVTAMQAREGDYRLSTWSEGLPLALEEGTPDLIKRVAKLRELVKDNPREPVFNVWLGDSLTALSRIDEAQAAWRAARDGHEGRTWPLPRLRCAESLLKQARFDEADEEAWEARLLAPNRAIVGVVYLEVQAARVQRNLSTRHSVDQLALGAAALDSDLAGLPQSESLAALRGRLIPPRMIFMARSGDRDGAIQLALSALESDRPLSRETVDRIAMAGTLERLGLEDAAAARLARGEAGSATVQYSRALDLAASGSTADGRRLLEGDVKARPNDPSARIALAHYLERVGENDAALAVWREVGQNFPTDLAAQRACLDSSAIAADPAFVEESIKRYQKLAGIESGADDIPSKLARARMLLHGRPSARDRDRAVAMLASVISQQPRSVDAKRMLAAALTYADNQQSVRPDLPRAIGALTDANTLEPSNTVVALELAKLLQLQGQFERSRELLNPIAANPALDLYSRRMAAEMLLAQGDVTPVADQALEDIADKLAERTPGSVLVALAGIYERRRNPERARELYERLASGAADDPESVYKTARYFSLSGDQARAEQVLARMSDVASAHSIAKSPAIMDLMHARLAAERGDQQVAARFFESAAKADPKLAETWRQYTAMLVRSSRFQDAAEVAERGLKEVPEDLSLTMMFDQAKLLLSDAADPEIAALAQALAAGSNVAASREILAAAKEMKSRGELNNVEALTRLTDRFPGSAPLQMWAIQRMAGLNQTRAIAMINRALAASPTDPAPAKFASLMYLELGRWNDLLAAATAWRDREGSRSPEPDIAIAEAYFNLRQYDRGIAALSGWLQGAIAAPGEPLSPNILNMHGKMMIAAGRHQQALEQLMPAFRSSIQARLVGMQLAGNLVPTVNAARSWVDALLAAAEPDSINDKLGAATVFSMLASRFPDQPELLDESRKILADLAASPDATGLVHESLGIVLHRMNDVTAAEEAYRKAIALDDRRAGAFNNLAYILAERDLDEAAAMARRAVDASSPRDSNHVDYLDTLADIHAKRAARQSTSAAANEDYLKAAKAYMEIAASRPGRYEPLLNAAQAATKARDYALALNAFETAMRLPMPDQQLAICRNNAAALRLKLHKDPAQAERARDEVLAAIRYQEIPNFYDTLGWANLATGRAGEAEEAFQRAIKLAGEGVPLVSARIGLAMAIAADQERRSEARSLLAQLDPSTLQQDDAELFDRARRQIETP